MSTPSISTDKLKILLEAAVLILDRRPEKLTNLKSVELGWEGHDHPDGDVSLLPTVKVTFR